MKRNGICMYINVCVRDVNKQYYVYRKHKYSKYCDKYKLPIGSGKIPVKLMDRKVVSYIKKNKLYDYPGS